MNTTLDKAVDIRYYLQVLWRRKGIILLCAVTTICATLVALSFVPKEYEASVTLMIADSQGLVSNELDKVTGGIMQSQNYYGADQARIDKIVGRITGRPFLEKVIRTLKMNEDPKIIRQAEELRRGHPEVSAEEMAIRILVQNLQSKIGFRMSGKGIFKIVVSDYSAGNAQLLARWISELLVDTSNQGSLDRLRLAHEFGAEQLKIYEQQLRQSEAALERQKQSAIEVNLTRSLVRDDNLPQSEALYGRIEDEVAAARIRLKEFSNGVAAMGMESDESALSVDSGVRELSQRLSTALKNDLADRLTGRSGDLGTWPPQGSYSSLRRDLLQQVEDVVSKRYPTASPEALGAVTRFVFSQIDLDAQQSAADMLDNAITGFKRQAESKPGGEIELSRLESDVETNRKLLQSFQAQLVASDVSQAMELTKLGERIEVLDPANLPFAPTRPNRKKILLASLFLGPLLGAGIAFLGETLDPTLRSLEDFRRIVPEPILGTTPLLSRIVNRQGWLRRNWAPAAVAGAVLLTIAFFMVRTGLVHNLSTVGQPVQLVSPEKALNEDR